MLEIVTSVNYDQEKKYIFDVIFGDFLGIDYSVRFEEKDMDRYLISMPDSAMNIILPDVFFNTPLPSWLKKDSLPVLPLRTIKSSKLDPNSKEDSIPVIFGIDETDDKQVVDSSIDIFGSIFFCLSLYEEYIDPRFDRFDRFLYTESIAYKANYYHRPIVNEYLEIFWKLLQSKFPSLKRKERRYKLVLSHDIDWPLANNLPLMEFAKECYRDLRYKKSFYLFMRRSFAKMFSLLGWKYALDPYNNFSFLMNISEKNDVTSEFNFIVINGETNPKDQFNYDCYYEFDSPFFKSVLKEIDRRGHIIGFHPSFYTLDNPQKLFNEFQKFKTVCADAGIIKEYWGGRQHYLRWQVPKSWQMWEDAGLSYDSSIGSEFLTGFRAGTCYSFKAYNIYERKALNLREHPLTVMDMTVFQDKRLQDSLQKILSLKEICKYYNGDFTILIHNNYVTTPKWKRFYARMIRLIKN